MKIFMLTGLYAAFLGSVMLWHGCSTEPDSSRSTQQFEEASASAPRPDPPADPLGTPPPTSLVSVDTREDIFENRPLLEALRDRVAQKHCIDPSSERGAPIRANLDLLECRVVEQLSWLQEPYLYTEIAANSCVEQIEAIERVVLSSEGKDANKKGEKWLETVCKSATSTAVKKVIDFSLYDEDDGYLPRESDVEAELKRQLKGLVEYKPNDKDEKHHHNIETALLYDLYRINHNCASYMDNHITTFPSLKKKNKNKNKELNKRGGGDDVTVKYILRQYYKYAGEDASSMDSDTVLLGRWWDVLQKENIINEYGSRSENDGNLTLVSHSRIPLPKTTTDQKPLDRLYELLGFEPEVFNTILREDIIPIRKINLRCVDEVEVGNAAYLRHATAGGTFFNHAKFLVSDLTPHCSSTIASMQRSVLSNLPPPPPPLSKRNNPLSGLKKDLKGCKVVYVPHNVTNIEKKLVTAIECFSRERSRLNDHCGGDGDMFDEFTEAYCEYGNYPRGELSVWKDDSQPSSESDACFDNFTDDTGAQENTNPISSKNACVFTLPLSSFSGADLAEPLARFLGISKDDLTTCAFDLGGGKKARDYVQYDLCASPLTYYTDAGDGETVTNPTVLRSIDSIKGIFCSHRIEDPPIVSH